MNKIVLVIGLILFLGGAIGISQLYEPVQDCNGLFAKIVSIFSPEIREKCQMAKDYLNYSYIATIVGIILTMISLIIGPKRIKLPKKPPLN